MSTASTDRRFRVARRACLLGLACLLFLSAVSESAAAAPTKPFTLDLGKRSDYVAQTNLVQCVGASMRMILNMIEPGVDQQRRPSSRLQKIARKLESAATRRA